MTKIEINGGSFDVDAATIANGLNLHPSMIPALMKAGEITSACERGEGPDVGRYRLTFRHGAKRHRITLDAAGAILASENC